MAWRIELDKDVERSLAKLDKQTARRITSKLREIAQLDDPRSAGKALVGNLAGLWRYRVGDYRIICDIEDEVLLVLVVDVAHRSEVYKHRR
ncbi:MULTISPECIES: type II toxin-antitoxin system RelE/ParE family toxin [unclassified Adlercreutzia]|uniref:type II toxin-antitoxin system RelE family toxin n=1 Tax=unclassified Adlercreutzia TaxID=2636013 RepID=UPI0013EA91B4|nr:MULTISPECIES: type II toxin-antitoxin system RelE/ParE family toxin [unclassified Adlercreutzia]